MKYLFPNSLAGRTLFILFVGLTLSHIVSILVFTSEKMEVAVLTSEQQLLERMAIVTRLLRDTPESLHIPVLSAMNRSGVHIEVTHNPDNQHLVPEHVIEPLRQQLEQWIDRQDVQVLWLQIRQPDWHHEFGILHRFLFWIEMHIIRTMHTEIIDQEWHLLLQFPKQRVLLSSHPAIDHIPLFRHASISVIIMSVAILLFVLVMVQHMIRPWQKIIQAAAIFGEDIYAPPLPEQGATEIVHAAQIFNRMNRRIKAFVEEQLQVIAAISHDLRTPLTQLRLMTEFSKTEEDRRRMISTLDEMEKMFAATLSFARDSVSNEPKQRLNLSGLLFAICSDMADAGMAVQCEEHEKLPYTCRPTAIKRALINLIDNAIQYGGRADVGIIRTQTSITISIFDPGLGIPTAEWENVMKPFRRLEPSRNLHTGGVGMGLAISHSVIRDHGGKIQFIHPPTGGFIVTVVLPLSDTTGGAVTVHTSQRGA